MPIEPLAIGVCSWSLQAANPQDLAAKLLATGIRRVQLALDPLRQTPEVWGDSPTLLQQKGISIISGMFPSQRGYITRSSR